MTEKAPRPAQTEAPPHLTPDEIQEPIPELPPDVVEQTTTEEIVATPDAKTRFTDAEILGRRYAVKRVVHEMGNQRLRAVEGVRARVDNIKDTPAKFRLGLARNIADARYNRQKRRLDELAHLPDTSRLKKRRMAKLAKAELRKNRAHSAYESHTNRMRDRIDSVGKNAEKRRNEYIKELRTRREHALARKSLRHELRDQRAGRLEIRAILKEIPKEHLDRVGYLAANVYLGDKIARRSEKITAKRTSEREVVEQRLSESAEKSRQYAEEARSAEATVAEIRDKHIPEAKQHAASLESSLAELSNDDPSRADLEAQLAEATHQVELYETRELPYWKSVAEESDHQANEQTQQHAELQGVLQSHKAAEAWASTTSDEHRAAADQGRFDRRAAIESALNN